MTIFFLCPKPGAPSGGVWFIHRLVSLLNQMGRNARVLQTEPFEVSWDAHPIPSSMIGRVGDPVNEGDVVVVPEVMFPAKVPVPYMVPGIRLVPFVQNYIWIPQGLNYEDEKVLVCSRFLANHMKRMTNAKVLGILSPYLDDDVWAPSPKIANKTLVMGRRNLVSERMRDMLEAQGFPVEYVTDNLTQRELADRFSDCEFYVHLVYPEGLPMIALEAMRSGTIVVGTTGGGGNEFMFDGQTAMVVSDPLSGRYSEEEFLDGIMAKMIELREKPELRSRIWTRAYEWSKRYNAEVTMAQLKEVFG